MRWILELESIDYKIEYVRGADNTVADAMRRVEIPANSNDGEADEEIDVYELRAEKNVGIDLRPGEGSSAYR